MAPVPKPVWLVVEDDDADFILFSRACRNALPNAPVLQRARDGLAAIEALRCLQLHPDLVVSDLHMMPMDGLHFVEWFREQRAFDSVPVVILSSSDAEEDRAGARRAGADDYEVKPSKLQDLVPLVRHLPGVRVGN